MPVKKFKITYSTGSSQRVIFISATSKYDAKTRFYRIYPGCEIISVKDERPCLGCLKRNVTSDYNCHSDCPDFREYREGIDKRNQSIKKANDEYAAMSDEKRRIRKEKGYK